MGWKDLASTLEHCDGVVGRDGLDAAGVTKRQLAGWIADRRLERVAAGVWRVVGASPTWRQQLRIGLLTLGPMSWVGYEAAAQLHGFDRTPPDRVEFLALRSQRGREFDVDVHFTRRWAPIDAVEVDGLRVTSATRTILDLANSCDRRSSHPDRIAAAIDSAVRRELASPEAIRLRLDELRGKGRAGVRKIERLLEHSGGHTMLERKFLELMSVAGLPRPTTQEVFRRPDDDQFVARVDFYFPGRGVVVEVTGRVGHSSPEERMRDAQRRNELQQLGLRVYEFTWEDVTQRQGFVISQMRRALQTSA